MTNTIQTTTTQAHIAIERPLPNSKLEAAFYKVVLLVADYDTVLTFRRLKAEGNTASATALATRIVIDRALYPLLETAHEYKQVIEEEKGPSIYDWPEMIPAHLLPK